MPRGIPKHKANGMSKMEGMRRALAKFGYDAAPTEIQNFLETEFGIDMDTKMISSYKTSLKGAGKSAAIRKPGRPAAAPLAADGIALDDIRQVKEVLDRVGAEKVRQLAAVLGE